MNCTQCSEEAVDGLCQTHWDELNAELEALRLEIKALKHNLAKAVNREAEAYWQVDEHGGGWNECWYCGKGPIRYSTLKTYPHIEGCPGAKYTGDFEG